MTVERKTIRRNSLADILVLTATGIPISSKTFLSKQVKDFKRLADTGKPLCVVGDYNLSFCDRCYYTSFGRETVLQSFRESRLRLLTAEAAECIDHIAVSEDFVCGSNIEISEWN